jgi:hypothetical protein
MAAADSSAAPYIPIVVQALPVILTPIVAWVLSRSRISRDAATIDYLNKRLDILERLNKLHTELTEGPIRALLETEVEHSRTFLSQPPTFITHGAEVEVPASQSFWAKFFLTQPAVSTRQRVYKGLFYLFFGFAVLSLPTGVILLVQPNSELPIPVILVSYVLGFAFYLGISLLFRRAAL